LRSAAQRVTRSITYSISAARSGEIEVESDACCSLLSVTLALLNRVSADVGSAGGPVAAVGALSDDGDGDVDSEHAREYCGGPCRGDGGEHGHDEL
jgi:hypothetical protein